MKFKTVGTIIGGLLVLSLLLGSMVEMAGNRQLTGKQVETGTKETAFSSAEIRAEGYILRGDYRQVELLLDGKVLSPRATVLLIKAELASGNLNQARSLLYRNYANPQLAGLMGLYLANKGYYQSAWEWFSSGQAIGKAKKADLDLGLCQVLIKLGKVEEAGQILQGLDRSQPEVMVAQGNLALAKGDYRTAWEVLTKVREQGYFTADNLFLTKLSLAALGADKDWATVTAQIRENQMYPGLAAYLEAQANLQKGDFGQALKLLQSALDNTVPEGLRPEIVNLQQELTARVGAEPAIQAVIARGGH